MGHNKFLTAQQITTVVFITAVMLSCSQKTDYLPQAVSGSVLKQKISGNEAKAHVNKIHFNPVVADKENDIGFYEGTDNNSTIYVTYYSKEEDAKSDFEKMVKKISPENSVFIAPVLLNFEGYRVYRCFGMGQTHFVFVHKDVLIWISTGTISGKDFLKEYINLIN